MNTYAVFGNPVLHSKSPQLFAPLLEPKENYTRIRPQSAQDLITIVKKLNTKGASITSPFKESVFPLLDDVSESAHAIGAVNCLRYDAGVLSGHNTDCFGVTFSLREAGISLQGAKVLVLGAGGAARAAVYGLVHAGAEVFVSNRTNSKAAALAKAFGARQVNWENPGILPYFDAVVSTILAEALPPFAGYLAFGYLLDAVYKPSEMTAHCRRRGIKVIPGERWLIHQGVFAADFYINKFKKDHKATASAQPEAGSSIESSKQELEEHHKRAALLENGLKNRLQPEKLRIFVLNEDSIDRFRPGQYDLIVSGFGLNEEKVKNIIDEEKHLAFGC